MFPEPIPGTAPSVPPRPAPQMVGRQWRSLWKQRRMHGWRNKIGKSHLRLISLSRPGDEEEVCELPRGMLVGSTSPAAAAAILLA